MRLYFEESGSPQLPTLLLVHGFPFDYTMWKAQLEGLSQDFHVIAPDVRGMGQSAANPDAAVTTMADAADDLAELLDQLGVRKCFYGGLSMGGYIGWEFWNRHADRLAGLLICDTNARPDSADAAENRRATADKVAAANSTAMLTAGKAKLMAPSTLEGCPEVVARYCEMVEKNNPVGVAAIARGMAQRVEFTSRLAEIDVPAVVICGEFDVLSTPEYMQGLANQLPNARFVQIPNAGHLSPMENPEAVNQAMRLILEG